MGDTVVRCLLLEGWQETGNTTVSSCTPAFLTCIVQTRVFARPSKRFGKYLCRTPYLYNVAPGWKKNSGDVTSWGYGVRRVSVFWRT